MREELLKDRETPVLKQRLILVTGIFSGSSCIFHGTYDVELAVFRRGWKATILPWVCQMILAAIVMVINQKFYQWF